MTSRAFAPSEAPSEASPDASPEDEAAVRLSAVARAVRRCAPLARETTLGVGGPAQVLVEAGDEREARAAVVVAHGLGLEVRCLGGGSNLLVRDGGARGIVLRITSELGPPQVRGRQVWCGAGVLLTRAIATSCRAGLAGLVELAGIPGTVGGAIAMNAGTRYGETGARVGAVRLLSRDGTVEELPASSLRFEYRNGNVGDRVVLGARFDLVEGDRVALRQRYHALVDEKRRSQPLSAATAGCFFKNPPGLHARELIREAGLVGARRGGACVSAIHANFLVNDAGASASDVEELADHVCRTVFARLGVALEREVRAWGQPRSRPST